MLPVRAQRSTGVSTSVRVVQGLLVVLTLFLAIPLIAQAAVPHIERRIERIQAEPLSGPLFLAGREVVLDVPVRGNVYILAERAELHGSIDGSVTLVARDVTSDAHISGDIQVVALSTALMGTIDGVASVASGQLSIDAQLTNLFAAAFSLTIDGTVMEDVWVATNQLQLAGMVKGGVHVRAPVVLVQPTAQLNSLHQVGRIDPVVAEGAQVSDLVFIQEPYRAYFSYQGYRAYIASWAGYALWLAVGSLLLVWLVPAWFTRVRSALSTRFFSNLWIGLGVFLIAPLVLAALLFSRVGWLIDSVLVLLILAALQVGFFAFSQVIGERVWFLFRRSTVARVWPALIGAAVVAGTMLIPVVGPLLQLIIVLLGLGTLTKVVWQARLKRVRPT